MEIEWKKEWNRGCQQVTLAPNHGFRNSWLLNIRKTSFLSLTLKREKSKRERLLKSQFCWCKF